MSNATDFLEDGQMRIISIVSLITSGLSFVGSGSILVCVVYHKRICAPEVFPIFHLSVADSLASLMVMVVSVIFLRSTVHSYPGVPGPCGYLMSILISLFVSTFFLTLGYALEAFIRLRRRLQSYLSVDAQQRNGVSNYCMYVVYFMSWIMPLALGTFLMLVTHFIKDDEISILLVLPAECSLCFPVFNSHQSYCWDHVEDGYNWWMMYRLIFLLPLVSVFIFNMVLYVCIARDFRQVSMRRGLLSYHQRQEETTLRKKVFMYQTAFIICWIPTIILICVSFMDSFVMADYYTLFVLQSILGPSQGFLNCIIYGWKRNSFRRALSETSPLLSTNRGGAMSFTL